MSKIIVAGAGHGGLTAAIYLAKAGYNVSVIEMKDESELGHDWDDRFTFSLLAEILGIDESELSRDEWYTRGDCAFVSPNKKKHIVINYSEADRQRIMNRKYVIGCLVDKAKSVGVEFYFNTKISGPVLMNGRVIGVLTSKGNATGDIVIDSAGVFSPVRSSLPDGFGIEKNPVCGDLFFAYRAYYEKGVKGNVPDIPFEVYMCHNGEKGLSWYNECDDFADILLGRIYEFDEEKVKKEIDVFRSEHPVFSHKIVRGGSFGVIPVRRPLALFVADGYAAVGDSAFMTTPMNGMGIDLSLSAGKLLAQCIIDAKTDNYSASVLWKYNRDYHLLYGAEVSKNAGLKNAILSMPSEGVDFLYENNVIQSSDLAGGGRNVKISSLLGKFIRGMKKPEYFFALVKGLMNGAKMFKFYKNPPREFNFEAVKEWSMKIKKYDVQYDL